MRAIGWDIGPLVVYSLAGLFHQKLGHIVLQAFDLTLHLHYSVLLL